MTGVASRTRSPSRAARASAIRWLPPATECVAKPPTLVPLSWRTSASWSSAGYAVETSIRAVIASRAPSAIGIDASASTTVPCPRRPCAAASRTAPYAATSSWRVTGSPPRGSRSPYVVPLSNSARPSRAAVSRITRLSGRMNSAPISTIPPVGSSCDQTRPPTRSRASNTRTSTPAVASASAAARPANPAPTTITRIAPSSIGHQRGSHRSPAGVRRVRANHRPVRGRSTRSRLDSGRAARHVARDPWRLRVGARPRLGPVAEGLARPVRAPDPERARRRVDRGRRDRGRDDRGGERAARGKSPRRLRRYPAELREPVHHRAVRQGPRRDRAPDARRRRRGGPAQRHRPSRDRSRGVDRGPAHGPPRLHRPADGPRHARRGLVAAEARRDLVRALHGHAHRARGRPPGRDPAGSRTRRRRSRPAASPTSRARRPPTSSARRWATSRSTRSRTWASTTRSTSSGSGPTSPTRRGPRTGRSRTR